MAVVPATGIFSLVALTGCPSPDVSGKFDGFIDDTEEKREEAQNVKLDVGGQLADVSGTFLFALDTIIQPGLPLQFIAEVTFTAEGAGGILAMTLQPLSLDQGSVTEPRVEVGDLIVVPDIEVDASGAFSIESLGVLNVVGAANPITGGAIKADVSLAGNIIDENLFCGQAGGEVFEPLMLDLTASTFAVQRLEATDPASLPGEMDLAVRCPADGGMMGEESGGGSDETGGSSGTGGSGGTSG